MSMWRETCLIQAAADVKEKKTSSCCGILIHPRHRFIVTHSTLIAPFLPKDEANKNTGEEVALKSLKDIKIRVILQKEASVVKFADIDHIRAVRNISTQNITGNESVNDSLKSNECDLKYFEASLVGVWKAEKFAQTLQKLMPKSEGWKLLDQDEEKKEKDWSEDTAFRLLPYFVLLKFHDSTVSVRTRQLTILPSSELRRGLPVSAVGTPFGDLSPEIFMNCISSGVLCNTVGTHNELLLTDARCIPGSEGGALFTSNGKKLIGMIVSPLCWKNSEWVGLTVGCSLAEILRSLSRQTNLGSMEIIQRTVPGLPLGPDVPGLSLVPDVPVVLVQYGATWGTGILLNGGVVVTCGHVVKFNPRAKVRVKLFAGDRAVWLRGGAVYASEEGRVYDIAVIQLDTEFVSLLEPKWEVASVMEGMPLYMVGHGLFAESHGLKPSVVKGNVAKVVRVNGQPIMIQSTCCVSGGASGGPLVDQSGRLVAMVTCNAKDKESGAAFPHINLAVPASRFWPVVQEFIRTRDLSVLSKLHLRSKKAQQLWNFAPEKSVPVKSML